VETLLGHDTGSALCRRAAETIITTACIGIAGAKGRFVTDTGGRRNALLWQPLHQDMTTEPDQLNPLL